MNQTQISSMTPIIINGKGLSIHQYFIEMCIRDRQKAMLISGKKYRPLIEDRVQRMAVYLMIGFFAFMFICTIISRASHSFTTAHVSVSSMTSKTLMNRAEMEGVIHAAAEKGISLPDGLKVVSVNAGEGKPVDKGLSLIHIWNTDSHGQGNPAGDSAGHKPDV